MKPRVVQPRRLDIEAFARGEGTLHGAASLRDMKRLADAVLATSDAPAGVRWEVRGCMRRVTGAGLKPALTLRAQAAAPMLCQRCLSPVEVALDIDRQFIFAADEDEATRLDADSEDDFLALTPNFDVLQLVEDELILALPLVPRHEDCSVPAAVEATAPPIGDIDAKRNPFEVLQALRRR